MTSTLALNIGPKDVAGIWDVSFGVGEDLPEGVTVVNAGVTREIEVLRGTDPDVATMLSGALRFEGSACFQRVQGGVAGTWYALRLVAPLSDGTNRTFAGRFQVVRLK